MNGTFSFSEKRRTFGTLGLSFMKVSIFEELILITLFLMNFPHFLPSFLAVISPSTSNDGIGIGGNILNMGKFSIFSASQMSG
jgi:hypothetical protein